MLYARCVGLAEDASYPLNPPSSQATRSHSGKAKSFEPKARRPTTGARNSTVNKVLNTIATVEIYKVCKSNKKKIKRFESEQKLLCRTRKNMKRL